MTSGTLRAESKFWSKVLVADPELCWVWTKGLNADGYGRTGSFLGNRVGRLTHRIAFALHYRREPAGLVLHSCDNPACCNPAHLREGTHAENMREAADKGRFCSGVRQWQCKLTDDDVRMLRGLAELGCKDKDLARAFGITSVTANQIRNRVRRGDVV